MNQEKKDKAIEEEFSLEEAFEQVEGTIALLEEEDITLEESFRAYQEGMKLLQYCNDKIDRVEKQVLKINEDGGLDEF
ncbi:MAG: exodeoxyribonuclease VII small subunit [Blautia sp.]|nr:exodeoxyribonuclease VII small subunit [Blautia sp.]MCM1201528.1 exodeoxyribonuclease VII small subunit [Bacteroides fragilis]